MKNIKLITVCFSSLLMISLLSCKKDYGNLNNPTIEDFLNNATQSQLNNLVSGTESGMRNSIEFYLDDIGILGREGYHFSGSEPRYVTDLLGANANTLTNSNFYIATPWAARYRVVKNCNVLEQAATNSTLITAEQRKGYIGFAKTIKAYQLLLNLNLTYNNGIRIDVANPDNLGPIVNYQTALAAIETTLEEGKTSLTGSAIAFQLSPGFAGFADVAGLLKFNRALAARVAAYEQKWPAVLANISESFFDLNADFYLGINNVFGTGSGDQLNQMFIPQNQTGEVRLAHPSFAADIAANDDRINKATLRTATASLNGLSSDRDLWVYKTSTAPLPIIRNEELILLYAEAKIQTGGAGNLGDAVTALNRIRTGHNVGIYAGAVTSAALINEMLLQRRYSLFFEGHRWIDMRRYNRLADLPLDRTDDDLWEQFPLPVSEN